MPMLFYEPQEDSELLRKHIARYTKGQVLEIGCGSGYLTLEASNYAKKVLAVDINPFAVFYAKRQALHLDNVEVRHSDLFQNVKGIFDTIICNPPYLPSEGAEPDDALTKSLVGGKHGYEFIERLLSQAKDYMKDDATLLLLFSSLTKKDMVDRFIDKYCFTAEKIDEEKFSFESLYVYAIKKSEWCVFFGRKGITGIKQLTKGKRGEIYTGEWKNKKVAMKFKRRESKAMMRLENEADFLKKLNKVKIGPTLLDAGKDYIIYTFIDGEFIKDVLETETDKEKIKDILLQVLDQMYDMDSMNIIKEEMHHPPKHIVITSQNKARLLDFERCRYTKNPKNITQFIQYIYRNAPLLSEKGIILPSRKDTNALIHDYKKMPDEVRYAKLKVKMFC